MAEYLIKGETLTAIGNAIRLQTGNDVTITPEDMPSQIMNIETGGIGGIKYKQIIYNEDNTITLIDRDDLVHTMICTYDGEKLVSITYDNKKVALKYNDATLSSIGTTTIDMGQYKDF